MILTLDIGNTNIVLIQYDEQKNIIYKKRHITKKAECDVYYNKLLTGFDATVVVVALECQPNDIALEVLAGEHIKKGDELFQVRTS